MGVNAQPAEDEFEGTWEIAALLLGDIESRYRRDRLRPGGAKPLEGEAKRQASLVILQVCQVYRNATESQRQRVWSFFEQAYSLSPYAVAAGNQAAAEFGRSHDVEKLELALLAWAISSADLRDNYLRFGGLYLEAVRLGQTPAPSFARIGRIAFGTLRTLLTEFEQTAFYQADLAPLVAPARRGRYRYLGRDYGQDGGGDPVKP